MTSAIEFMQHVSEMCTYTECKDCPFKAKEDECEAIMYIARLYDREIADLVKNVEKWQSDEVEKQEAKKATDDKYWYNEGLNG